MMQPPGNETSTWASDRHTRTYGRNGDALPDRSRRYQCKPYNTNALALWGCGNGHPKLAVGAARYSAGPTAVVRPRI
jgi:hypothetical protein